MERKVLVTLEAKELTLLRGLNAAIDEAAIRYSTTLGFVAARDNITDPNARFDLAAGEFYLPADNKSKVVELTANDNG